MMSDLNSSILPGLLLNSYYPLKTRQQLIDLSKKKTAERLFLLLAALVCNTSFIFLINQNKFS